MAGVGGISSFGTSALHAIEQLTARSSALADRVSNTNVADDPTAFAAALVEMSEVRLQSRAAVAVLHTTHSLADELLSRPRR